MKRYCRYIKDFEEISSELEEVLANLSDNLIGNDFSWI